MHAKGCVWAEVTEVRVGPALMTQKSTALSAFGAAVDERAVNGVVWPVGAARGW